MLAIGDHLVTVPAAEVIGHQAPFAPDLDSCGRGSDINKASYTARVNGIVVAVQADIVIPWQSHPHP